MNEYALIIGGTFQAIRRYAEKPADILHKQVTWHLVVREYGIPFTGLENGDWVIRTVDPATLPPEVPSSISSRQFRLQLRIMGRLAAVKNYITAATEPTQIYFEYETLIRRNDPEILAMATNFNLTAVEIDNLFIAAARL